MRWEVVKDQPLWLGLGGPPTPHLGQGRRPTLPHSHHVRAWAPGDPYRTPGALSRVEVLELRARAAAGELDAALSVAYGLPPRQVARVRTGERRADVGGELTHRSQARRWTDEEKAAASATAHHTRGWWITPDQAVELREQAAAGAPDSALAEQYGVSAGYVQLVRLGHVYADSGGPVTRRSARGWSAEDDALLLRLRAAGLTLEKCGVILGRCTSAVGHRCHRLQP